MVKRARRGKATGGGRKRGERAGEERKRQQGGAEKARKEEEKTLVTKEEGKVTGANSTSGGRWRVGAMSSSREESRSAMEPSTVMWGRGMMC